MPNNATYSLGPIAPGVSMNGTIVTPGTVTYNPPLTKLYVGTGGSVEIVLAQTGTVTLTTTTSGVIIDNVAILSVPTATATGLVGFW